MNHLISVIFYTVLELTGNQHILAFEVENYAKKWSEKYLVETSEIVVIKIKPFITWHPVIEHWLSHNKLLFYLLFRSCYGNWASPWRWANSICWGRTWNETEHFDGNKNCKTYHLHKLHYSVTQKEPVWQVCVFTLPIQIKHSFVYVC